MFDQIPEGSSLWGSPATSAFMQNLAETYAVAGPSGDAVSQLSDADKQALVGNMTTGAFAGIGIGAVLGWYSRDWAQSRLKGAGGLAMAGTILWLGNRFVGGAPLATKAQTADGIKTITMADWVLATAPGVVGTTWLATGLWRIFKRHA